MSQQLLVPLRCGDLIEETLPYVEDIAQPGMTVVFLIHFGSNQFKEVAAQLLTIDAELLVNLDPRAGCERLSNVERRIQRATETLRRRGVAIRIRFYTGSLRRLVRQCIDAEPVKWLIMCPARSRLLRWCHAIAAALRVATPPSAAPVLLLVPKVSAGGE